MSEPCLLAITPADTAPAGADVVRSGVPGWHCTGLQSWSQAANQADTCQAIVLIGPDDASLPPLVTAIRQTWPVLPLVVLGPAAGSDLEATCLRAGADECLDTCQATADTLAAALRRAQIRQERDLPTNDHLVTTYASDVITQADLDGVLLYVSSAITPMLGFAPEELIGRSIGELLHPDDLPAFAVNVARLRTSTTTETILYRIRHANGEYRWTESTARRVRVAGKNVESIVSTTRDITERVEAEQARQSLETNLQAVIDGTTDMVLAVDPQIRLAAFNQAFYHAFALQHGRHPALGESPLDGQSPELARQLADAYERALAGDHVTLEYAADIQGHPEVAELSFNPILTPTGVTGVWCIGKNITARKAQEADLRRDKEMAEAATRAKSDFLAVMSHEIRTPLHAVLGMTDLLLETSLDAEQRDYTESLHQAAGTLATIIDDILDFSKLEAGKLVLHQEPVDIEALIHEVAEPMAVRAFDKGLCFVLHLDPSLPPEVVTDGTRLRQVLLNLLGNALKFTDAGVIGLELLQGTGAPQGHCRLEVAVRDTGVGIPTHKQGALFQRFSQADTSTTRRFGGTGLGLAICQELVQLLGGEIRLESQEGVGSTFRFALDVPIGATAMPATCEGPSGHRILAIAPHPWRQAALRHYAAAWGSDIRIAATTDQATERLLIEDWQPDVVVIDWMAHTQDRSGPSSTPPDTWGVPAVLLLPVRLRRQRAAKLAEGYSDCVLEPVLPSQLGQRLAAVITAPPQPADVSAPAGRIMANAGYPGRVLVVDDNAINLKMAQRMLEKLGCSVETAIGGGEAVAKVERTRYDLVLMDCQMPEIDGYQATRAIRQMPTGQNVPVIAITAYALPGDRERCLQAGMNDYLSKPVRRHSLQGMLDRWLTPSAPIPASTMIDVEQLHHLVDGDTELLSEIIQAYLAEAPHLLQSLQAAGSQGDAVALARAAHKLKGALINLAVGEAAEIAKTIETAARQGDTVQAIALLPALEALLQQLPAYLQALLPESRPADA
jgi:PAS domain S-box-containing protein